MLRKTTALLVLTLGLLAIVPRSENTVLGAQEGPPAATPDPLPAGNAIQPPNMQILDVHNIKVTFELKSDTYVAKLEGPVSGVRVEHKRFDFSLLKIKPISETCELSRKNPECTIWHGDAEDKEGDVVKFQLNDNEIVAHCRWWSGPFEGGFLKHSKPLK